MKMENFSSGRLYIGHSVFSDRGAVYSSYFVEYRHRLRERSTQRSRSVDYYVALYVRGVAHVRQEYSSCTSIRRERRFISSSCLVYGVALSRAGCSSCSPIVCSSHFPGAAGTSPTGRLLPPTNEPLPRGVSPMDGHGRA